MIIREVTPHINYSLKIIAEDGTIGIFDVKPYLKYEVFSQLAEMSEFEKVSNGHYFIEWECGADLSADTIEARMEVVNTSANACVSGK